MLRRQSCIGRAPASAAFVAQLSMHRSVMSLHTGLHIAANSHSRCSSRLGETCLAVPSTVQLGCTAKLFAHAAAARLLHLAQARTWPAAAGLPRVQIGVRHTATSKQCVVEHRSPPLRGSPAAHTWPAGITLLLLLLSAVGERHLRLRWLLEARGIAGLGLADGIICHLATGATGLALLWRCDNTMI